MEYSRLKSCFAICSAWMFISHEIAIYRFSADASNSCKSFGLHSNFSPYGIRYKLIERIQKSKGLRMRETRWKWRMVRPCPKVRVYRQGKKYFFCTRTRLELSIIYHSKTISRWRFCYEIFRIFFLKCFTTFKSVKINLLANISRPNV